MGKWVGIVPLCEAYRLLTQYEADNALIILPNPIAYQYPKPIFSAHNRGFYHGKEYD